MKKLLLFVVLVFLALVVAGFYGIVHDQITYTISPEYYTKFKFYQFGLVDDSVKAPIESPRIAVSVVGWLATWWMGLLIGPVLGLVALVYLTPGQMFRTTWRAFLVTIAVAFGTGFLGLIFGWFYYDSESHWRFSDEVVDRLRFFMVGSMHTFSYMGGLFGLITGMIYIKKQGKR